MQEFSHHEAECQTTSIHGDLRDVLGRDRRNLSNVMAFPRGTGVKLPLNLLGLFPLFRTLYPHCCFKFLLADIRPVEHLIATYCSFVIVKSLHGLTRGEYSLMLYWR
jgi:hypothetical protein